MMAASDSAAELAREGPLPGQHLVEDDAERELVAPEVDDLAPRLLRRHVGHRPEDDPLLAQGRERGRPGVGWIVAGDLVPGQAEVEELGVAVLRQEDVLGLDVAVDDSLPVRRREAFRHLQPDVESLPERQRPLGQRLAQRLAFQKLLDEEIPAGDFFE